MGSLAEDLKKKSTHVASRELGMAAELRKCALGEACDLCDNKCFVYERVNYPMGDLSVEIKSMKLCESCWGTDKARRIAGQLGNSVIDLVEAARKRWAVKKE